MHTCRNYLTMNDDLIVRVSNGTIKRETSVINSDDFQQNGKMLSRR